VTSRGSVALLLQRLLAILRIRPYRRLATGLAALYLILYLAALQDLSLGGTGFQVLTTDWHRMFDRTGALTFEPIVQVRIPGLTLLLSPVNLLVGTLVALLAGLNLTVTYLAFRQPAACRFNRATGMLASLPALLAGSACCAPAVVLILGLQASSLLITAFQTLIPVSVMLLLLSLVLILRRTEPERIAM
jgi:hypothetical protein